MRLPDPGKSRALVLGCSSYADSSLPGLPSVVANRAGMKDVLTSPRGTRLPRKHCVVLEEGDHVPAKIGSRLTALADEAEDMLLVYYAGHGLIGPNGELFLALPETRCNRDDLVPWTALPFNLVRSALAGAHARNRVLILDCCFSGLAIGLMSEVTSAVSGQLEVKGTCTLGSSPANRPSSAPPGAKYTAYTGEFLRLLQRGLADQPELLTLTVIHEHLVRALSSRGLPVPVQRNTETIRQLALVPNRLWTPPSPRINGVTRHPVPRRSSSAPTDGPTPPGGKTHVTSAGHRRNFSLSLLAGVVVLAGGFPAYLLLAAHQPSASTAGRHPTGAATRPAASTAHVTGTIPIGTEFDEPLFVAVDPATHTAYITTDDNPSRGGVSVIDTVTNAVTATIRAGQFNLPGGEMAIDPATHTAYVTNFSDCSVSVIDTAANTVTATIPVPKQSDGVTAGPNNVMVDPATRTVYVANEVSDSVSVIDTATNTVTATIPVGRGPGGMAVDPATHTAYVANTLGDSVSVIDTATNTVFATIRGGKDPSAVAVDSATHTAYIANAVTNNVSVVDTVSNTITASVHTDLGPVAVAVDPAAHTAYVADSSSDSVSVIDTATNSVTATIPLSAMPDGVAVDPATHTVYIADTSLTSSAITVIKPG